ncbi:hypothetical protein B0H14DRAFT_3128688, partial [Mycena olivaceomarginata]
MAPRNLPPLGPPPAHCLPPIPEPLCNCIANRKLVVKLQTECQRRLELGYNLVAKLYYQLENLGELSLSIKAPDELETSACGEPDMDRLGTTSDELNPRTTNRIDQVCDAPRDETHTAQVHPRDAVSGVHEKN